MKSALMALCLCWLAPIFSAERPWSVAEKKILRQWMEEISLALFSPAAAELQKRWDSSNRDCAGFIRYLLWEPFTRHNEHFLALRGANFRRLPIIPSDRRPRLRISSGVSGHGYASAEALWRFNTVPLGRERGNLLTGDLLFFRTADGYHTMLVLKPGKKPPLLIYHTGNAHGLRLLPLEDLHRHPNARWHPDASNPDFLGFYRLQFLAESENYKNP